ncbi:hypothetical protein [Spirillospora sp. NPDC029432]|uniref:hypothetical protein n=1 Tax=Spirillospora sp. NPDC029432 TaxID=3154599 RepID=UPI003454AF6E
MKYELQSEFALHYAAIGKAEGVAEGEARAILKILAARGLEPSDEERARIRSCSDEEQLDVWLGRAVSAGSVAEVFGGARS